jgi:iron complex outermembrane receptor protein
VGFIYDLNANPTANNTTSPAFRQRTNSYAAFGSVTYNIMDNWKVSGGLRYTDEAKRSHAIGRRGFLNPALGYFADRLTNVTQYLDGNLKSDDRVLTWDATTSYDPRPGLMLYVRVAKGFRSTAFNDAPFAASSFTKEPPEKLVDYEGGFKWRVNPEFTATADVFYYDYKNKLVTQVINNVQTFTSAPATVKGAEATLAWRPIPQLELGGSATLADAKYRSFPDAAVPTVFSPTGFTDLSHRRLPNAPKLSVVLNARYDLDTDMGRFSFGTNWSYRSKMFFRDYLANIDQYTFPATVDANIMRSAAVQRAYWIGNFDVTYEPTHAISVTAFVRNVANKRYTSSYSILTTFSEVTLTPGDPRSYGVSLRYSY